MKIDTFSHTCQILICNHDNGQTLTIVSVIHPHAGLLRKRVLILNEYFLGIIIVLLKKKIPHKMSVEINQICK